MSLQSTREIEKNKIELEVLIEKADFDAAVQAAYRKNVSKINVPGFRKGKAPKGIIEKMYGKGVFYEDALNAVLPDILSGAVEESKAQVVSRPEIDVGEIGDEGVQVKAVYFVKPQVSMDGYQGIPAEKVIKTVTEEEIDAAIDRDRERGARMTEVDREAKAGDFATIDYLGTVDGVPFDGGKAEGHKLELGSGSFIPGFEEQVAGHKAGEEFEVNVTFPEEYHAEALKGKDAVFAVRLHKVEEKTLPAPDDEFAKDISEFDTFDEYKADVKATIEKRYEDAAAHAVESQILEKLAEKLQADIPDCMFESETEQMVEEYGYRMQAQGIDLQMYLKYTGMTLEQMKEQFKPQAEQKVKTRLALEKIVELENIVPSEEEIGAEYQKLADAYQQEIDKIKEMVKPDMISMDVATRKALDFVKEKAVITETAEKKEEAADAPAEQEKPTEEKKPAKKPAAKKPAAKKTEE